MKILDTKQSSVLHCSLMITFLYFFLLLLLFEDASIRRAENPKNKALKTYQHRLSGDLLDCGSIVSSQSGKPLISSDDGKRTWAHILDVADECAANIRALKLNNDIACSNPETILKSLS